MGSRGFINKLRLSAQGSHADTSRWGPIGLDIGTELFNLVQVERRKTGPAVHAAVSHALGQERESLITDAKLFRSVLKRVQKQQPFHGRRIVATVPPPYVQLLYVSYQFRRHQDEQEVVVEAIRERLGTKLDVSVVDYIPIRPKSEEQSDRSCLVAVADREKVLEFLEVLRRAGLEVDALEVGPTAIKRLVSWMIRDDLDKTIVALNFGSHKSYLTAMWGRRLLMDREIDYGLDTALTALSASLEVSREEATKLAFRYGVIVNESAPEQQKEVTKVLAEILKPGLTRMGEEIERVTAYIATETRGGGVEKCLLFGSVARWPGLDQMLSALLSFPAETIEPFFGIDAQQRLLAQSAAAPVSGIAVATGLALR